MKNRLSSEMLASHSEPSKNHTRYFNNIRASYQDRIDFERLKGKLRSYHLPLVQRLLPDGKIYGCEYSSLNPTRSDAMRGSFKVNLRTGKWSDFATGDRGGDIISLWAYIRNLSQVEAAKDLQAIVGGV